MFFFLGAHCPRLFLTGSTCYLLLRLFFTCIVSLGSSDLDLYLAILVPIGTSSLVRIAGGRRCALPPAPPPPAFTFCFYFLIGSPCYLLSLLFLIHLTIFLLIAIESCACVLLSCYALRGEALRPPPCHPPTSFTFGFYFLIGSPCYLLSLLLLGSSYFYWYLSRLVPVCFFLGTHGCARVCF